MPLSPACVCSVASAIVSVATGAGFALLLLLSIGGFDERVPAVHDPSHYGFGPNKTLLVFNLTALAGVTKDGERGLEGRRDVHPSIERLASLTMYKHGAVFQHPAPFGKKVLDLPIALDQKGGDRPQINLGFEFREDDVDDEDYLVDGTDVALLEDVDAELEDYFVRGCWFEPSCTRDFAPTVLDVAPQMRGELVEVLFWEEGTGYTYEGVYGLFAKLKRDFYREAVPWSSGGKVTKSDPCSDDLGDIALIFESEVEREGRGKYNAFERLVQADMVYPSSSKEAHFRTMEAGCPGTYQTVVDYFSLPNLENASEVPLDLGTFVRMYVANELMQQADFGFRGAQQYYYKSPGTLELSVGPPYDFDGPWDLCGLWNVFPDIAACHFAGPSPIWERLGRHRPFLEAVVEHGPRSLNRSFVRVDELYGERVGLARQGYFDRHDARWPARGRVTDMLSFLIDQGRRMRHEPRGSVEEELVYQRRRLEARFGDMAAGLASMRPNPTAPPRGFSVYTTHHPYVFLFSVRFWWLMVFGIGGLLVSFLSGLVVVCRRCRRAATPVAPVRAGAAAPKSVPQRERELANLRRI